MRPGRVFVIGILLTVAYVVAARFGFALAFVAEQVTTVWAPTGIAQAALLLGGVRLWPAVWLGAFIANAATGAPLWTAPLIATGNTLEAVTVAVILSRSRFDPALLRFVDAARFVVVGAMAATAVSATIGVTTLCVAGVQPWAQYSALWWAWWIGDALGSLVVAPLLLTASARTLSVRRWVNASLLAVAAIAITQLAFGGMLGQIFGHGPLHYVLFPLVILAAVKFGQPETALVVLSVSTVTIMNTVRGLGPFAAPDVNESLILLQSFMGVLAVTGMLLAAAVTQGQASEEQLRDADRRKDEFLAVLAHELRNPLAPLRMGLELVRLSGDDPATMRKLRSMMERQIVHMVRLIDDLLDVSRITSGKIHLQRKDAWLADVVHAAVEANRTAIDACGARLSVQLPAEPVSLVVDSTRLVQVISNLLHNAAKFTDAKGTIVVNATVVQADAGEMLRVSVADTGIGIPNNLLPRIFDLFTQGERSAKSASTGLGIGLALAQKIVDMHGGRIEARSDGPGQGSEFVIHLPLVRGSAVAPAADSPADLQLARGRRVLVIDDNADAADMLATLVRSLGGEARTANDGAAGVRAAEEFKPDLVMLDIGMPGMDGYETCQRIRALGLADPKIVAVTGWGQDRDKARAAATGFDAHLTKPADPGEVERLLSL